MASEFQRTEEAALLPGAELWVVPTLDASPWTQKIDWYLNFQILRSTEHLAPEPPPELRDVVAEWEHEVPAIEVSKAAPLMVASSELLPNHAVVVVPPAGSPAAWVESVHKVWTKLDRPSLRVFLPEALGAQDFASSWPKSDRDSLSQALVP